MGATSLKIAGAVSSDKARKEQRSANKKKEAQSRLSSARDAMAQVRQTRIAQAQIIQSAATNGTQSSSAAQGGYSAVGSLTSGNMQFLNQMDSINSQISSHLNKANLYGQQAGLYNAGADLAMKAVSAAGGGG